MNEEWDNDIAFQPSTWKAIKEVLYPGAFGMAFASSRGWHRMAVAIEDAGFIFHPTVFCLCWAYGSGFPKATRIDTRIDKELGLERKTVGTYKCGTAPQPMDWGKAGEEKAVTEPASEESKIWAGHRYGLQAMKPAVEPIVVFQKPYEKRPLDNITKTGAGALNIDAGRITTDPAKDDMLRTTERGKRQTDTWEDGSGFKNEKNPLTGVRAEGRWPANLALQHLPGCKNIGVKKVVNPSGSLDKEYEQRNRVYGKFDKRETWKKYGDEDGMETVEDWECEDGCPIKALDAQSGEREGCKPHLVRQHSRGYEGGWKPFDAVKGYEDEGGASRFYFNADWNYETQEGILQSNALFYCPKASREERDAGLDAPTKDITMGLDARGRTLEREDGSKTLADRFATEGINCHPTVKPVALNSWLASLLLPPAKYAPRRLFAPFAGVASEMVGALRVGWEEVVGVEMSKEYVPIGQARLRYWADMDEAQQRRFSGRIEKEKKAKEQKLSSLDSWTEK
jgi:hypothetical protein